MTDFPASEASPPWPQCLSEIGDGDGGGTGEVPALGS